jgi:YkoY family integral membrane protein
MELIHQVLGPDIPAALLIILNLVVIESLLSVDNAAVLATMVMDLPPTQRGRALKYGIIGAYVFRGIALVLAAWLVQIWWLKPLGGIYLLYLTRDYYLSHSTPDTEDDTLNKEGNFFYRMTLGWMGKFWSTVVLVEVMDMAFSIDNVFAAVAFTDNIYLICTGVFIGILAMRFVAQSFVALMEKYPALETSAFVVIGILGVKLLLSLPCHFMPGVLCGWLEGESADMVLSLLTVLVFLFPLLRGWLKKG